jgi:hypothetical protein
MPSVIVSTEAMSFNISTPTVPTISSNLPNIAEPQGGGLSKGSTGGGTPQSNPFGSAVEDSANPGLVGYLYDLKQSAYRSATKMSPSGYHKILTDFVAADWNESVLNSYYKSPKPLNTVYIFIPTIHASDGPAAFGVQNEVQPKMYAIWYKATVVAQQAGTFHFCGMADDILVVRVNGQTVLDGSLTAVDKDLWNSEARIPVTDYKVTNSTEHRGLFKGKPFQVNVGDQVQLDVLIGEEPGGWSNYFLYIQREESSYKTMSNGSPLLPIFHLDSNPIQPHGDAETFPPFQPDSDPF